MSNFTPIGELLEAIKDRITGDELASIGFYAMENRLAAAPAMYEALRHAKSALYNVPEVGKRYDQQHSHTHALACLDVEAAIALAEVMA